MSFNRLTYDTCTYKTNLRQSIGPGDHFLNTPTQECTACFSTDPNLRVARFGGAICGDKPLIDVDSELMGLTRKASQCPVDHYIPGMPRKQYCNMMPIQDCRAIPTEDTRMSNPPCTLRGTGINRFEWLCWEPQAKALMPFDFMVNNRTIVKDNHRPCLPKPINQASIMPPGNASNDVVKMADMCSDPQHGIQGIPSTHWKTQSSMGDYLTTWT